MSEILPPSFLFRVSFPVRRQANLPKKGRRLLALTAEHALPEFGELDQGTIFGKIRAAWNPQGLGFGVEVRGKKRPLHCDPRQPFDSDGINLWIDTRSTQNVHRATRFCHHFFAMPAGAGTGKKQPAACQLPIARAKEESPLARPEQILLSVEHLSDGYALDIWLPAAILNGFEPETNPRLGFYYALRDGELGEQYLSVGPEFPFSHDPSVWWTMELV